MRSIFLAGAVGLGLALSVAPPAWAQSEPAATQEAVASLRKARGYLESGDFERAIRTVDSVLNRGENLSEPMQAEAYRLLGLAHLYLGREAQARQAYEKLLRIQPDYQLPSTA